MLAEFPSRLHAFATVIVRVGLNLQPGQKLLIAEPYELQGVARSARGLVEAVQVAAGREIDVIWGDEARLRDFAERADWNGFERLVEANARRMKKHLAERGAFLFLVGSQPRLLDGIGAERTGLLNRIAWQHFGPIVQKLTRGASQWVLAPAPSPEWAEAAFAQLPQAEREPALWSAIFSACRCDTAEPVPAWEKQLARLAAGRDGLNRRRLKKLRYHGAGTDLTVSLPGGHTWCTARMTTKAGISFVANLPTEEVFTAPHLSSAEGTARVSRPINYGGAVIDGVELRFADGCVRSAKARVGEDLLRRLLATDGGAHRLGEVDLVGEALRQFTNSDAPAEPPEANAWARHRLFYHTLLDENSSNHIALGESYPFCNQSFFPFSLNRSLIHVDLPLEAEVTFSPA